MPATGYLFKMIKGSFGQQILQDKVFRHGGSQSRGSGMTHHQTNQSEKFQRVVVGSVCGPYFLRQMLWLLSSHFPFCHASYPKCVSVSTYPWNDSSYHHYVQCLDFVICKMTSVKPVPRLMPWGIFEHQKDTGYKTLVSLLVLNYY